MKNGLLVNIALGSLLGLTFGACDTGDEEPAPAASAPAAEGSFDVISVVRGPDGKFGSTRTRMTESQWQGVLERRKNPSKPRPLGDSSVFETQQAYTVVDSNCSLAGSSLFFSGYNSTGTRTCLFDWWGDNGTPDMDYDVGYSIKSVILGNYGRSLVCTGTYDCNVWTCGNGVSVWAAYGACTNPYGIGCSGNVTQPPPQTYMFPHWVHMQGAPPFMCH